MCSAAVPVVTIDGPSGVGKGTIGRLLSLKLRWNYLDSGVLYRVLAVYALNNQTPLNDAKALSKLAMEMPCRFELDLAHDKTLVWLENNQVTEQVRSQQSGETASQISVIPEVRQALLEKQRAFRVAPGLVTDGRDMGTVIFPDATVKVFLDADVQERAKRRYNELRQKGISANLGEVLHELKIRDERDRNRSIAPLKPAHDAWILDSTHLSIEDVLALVESRVRGSIA